MDKQESKSNETKVATTKITTEEKKMNTTEFEVLETGNMTVTVVGVATVALTIIGLAGIYPLGLVSIAAIVVGAGLLLAGIAIGAEKKHILSETIEGRIGPIAFTSGIGIEMIAGIASIVLGILSLLNYSAILLGADAIVLGLALLFACATDTRLNGYRLSAMGEAASRHKLAHESVAAAIDFQFLVGLAAITLGILAIIGIASNILLLVAFLAVGASLAFKGTTLAARVFGERNEI